VRSLREREREGEREHAKFKIKLVVGEFDKYTLSFEKHVDKE